jgi:hypothetical protein
MTDHGSCKDCFYFEPFGTQGLVAQKRPTGKCRRNAPTPSFVSGVRTVRRDPDNWPVVAEDDWCGEYRARKI